MIPRWVSRTPMILLLSTISLLSILTSPNRVQADNISYPVTFVAGNILPASSLNSNFLAVSNVVNGNITDGNIKAAAGIQASKIAFGLTNGQLLIGSTGVAPVAATITGTANQVVVTNGAGTITLSSPQAIGPGSSPTFNSLTLTNPLTVPNGGTGNSSFTPHGVMLAQGPLAMVATGVGSTGIPLVGVSGNDPIFGTAAVGGGGTGAITFTAHGVLLGEGVSAITPTAAMTNGQLLVGSTGADPVPASVTSTGNTITVTGGAGTLNLDTVAGIQKATYNLTSGNITGMNASPVTVLAGVASKTIVPVSISMTFTEAGAAYGGGGNISFQYHGGSTITNTVGASAITAASGSTYSFWSPTSGSIAAQATGIDITNATGAFTSAGATGTGTITIYYYTF